MVCLEFLSHFDVFFKVLSHKLLLYPWNNPVRKGISISKTVSKTSNTGSTKEKGEEVDRTREMTKKDVSEEANHRDGKHKS